ncbi:hypothetical protein [Janthinobacterium sp. UMAB-56]|uniref:hypothetical protein n=1 Tax=Janthinobacterium sp. UMAB-56 TaxID=1365361 RepID=UPI001C59D244|nr:hypothetical protein [Janthinobacterium sp. UMAB-56]
MPSITDACDVEISPATLSDMAARTGPGRLSPAQRYHGALDADDLTYDIVEAP